MGGTPMKMKFRAPWMLRGLGQPTYCTRWTTTRAYYCMTNTTSAGRFFGRRQHQTTHKSLNLGKVLVDELG